MPIDYQHLPQAILENLKVDPHRQCISLAIEETESVQHLTITRQELDELIGQYIGSMNASGIQQGDKVVVILPISFHLIAAIVAVMAIGATVVLIDVSMSPKNIINSIKEANAKLLICNAKLRLISFFIPATWRIAKLKVENTHSKQLDHRKQKVRSQAWSVHRAAEDSPALITFTSGTTGRPKAVNRTHRILAKQRQAIWNNHPKHEGALLHCFPVLILYHLSVGTHSVLAHNASFPALSRPEETLAQLRSYNADAMIAAPTFLNNLFGTTHPEASKIFDKLRFVGVGGAPVPYRLLKLVTDKCPKAIKWIVFGSTEAEPIAHISFEDAIRAGVGNGYPVGKVVNEIDARILEPIGKMPVSDTELESHDLANNKVGELLICGEHVVEEYLNNPEANAKTKLRTQEGRLWHRCGDLAYRNSDDQLFLVGRCGDEILSGNAKIYPFQIEYQVDALDNVKRSCLLQVDNKTVLVIEASNNQRDVNETSVQNILNTQDIKDVKIQYVRTMPVDKRHNSKIDRNALRRMIVS